MPELPEVETVMRGLAAILDGQRIADAGARRADIRFPLPERLAERRAAWQRLADTHGAGLLCADLEAPELEAAERSLKTALQR